MDNMSCPVCFSNNILFQFKIDNNNFTDKILNYYRCKNCFYFYRIPDTLLIDYKNDYVNVNLINKSKKLAQNYFDYTKSIIKIKDNLLEIGGSLGYFCKIVQDNMNLHCINFELSDYALNYSNNIEVQSINNFDNLKSNSFDNIVSFHVLEHIPPNEIILFFENILNLLADDGKILLFTPNANNKKLDLLKKYYGWLAPSEHIGFFDIRTIIYILKQLEEKTGEKFILTFNSKIPSFYHYPVVSFISMFRNKFKIKSSDFETHKEYKIQKPNFKNKIIQYFKSLFSFFLIFEKLLFLPFYLIFDLIYKENDELVITIQKSKK